MTQQQVYDLAREVGFPPASARMVVAIATHESSRNPGAHNPVPPDDSYGLMQINMIGALGPERRAAWGLSSNSELFDPLTNMRAAYSLWNGSDSNFRHWSTLALAKRTEPGLPGFEGSGSGGAEGAAEQLASIAGSNLMLTVGCAIAAAIVIDFVLGD